MNPEIHVQTFQAGLNLVTLFRAALEEAVTAAAGAGFGFVEIWTDPLEKYLQKRNAEDVRRLLNRHRVQALSIGDIESITFCTPEQLREIADRCAKLAAVAREIGCPTIVVSGSVRPKGTPPAAVAKELEKSLERLLDAVEPYGVGLALNFRGFSWCSVNSLEQAVEVVDRLRERRLSLALDTFDLHACKVSPRVLEGLDPKKISVLRISDSADVVQPILTDAARLLPGEGIAKLEPMLQALANMGFSGAAFVKVVSPRLLEVPPEEIARMAMAAAESCLAVARPEARGKC